MFRPEYSSSLIDVRFNKKSNKTFYKWVIDDFKKSIPSLKVFDEILEIVFKGRDGISKSFDKLLYESGKRNWSTFEELFKNEQKNEKLWVLLNKDRKYLAAYEIFQSRMFAAFFLENLCAELPNFIGKENADELKKIITGDKTRKRPEDFLVPNHEEKTKTMTENFLELWGAPDGSNENVLRLLDKFDRNCPATEVFKSYFSLYLPTLKRKLTKTEAKNAFDSCQKNRIFFENYDLYNYLNDISV